MSSEEEIGVEERLKEIREFYSGPPVDKDGRQCHVNFEHAQKDVNFASVFLFFHKIKERQSWQ